MTLSQLTRAFILLGRGTRRRLVTASIGLTLGVILITLFIASGLSLRDILLRDVLGALPITQLKVQARTRDVGVLKIGSAADQKLDQETIAALAALPEVNAVYALAFAHFPVSIRGEVLGSSVGTDAPVQGVDPAWVADEIDPARPFEYVVGEPVPVLVSRKVLQAYNVGFASANQLPQLSEGAVVGQELEITFGASSLGGTRAGSEALPAVIVGFSDRVDALALAIPLEALQSFAVRFDDQGSAGALDAAVLDVRSTGDLSRVEAAVADLGLELSPDAYFGRQVGQAMTIVILFLTAVGVAVALLSLLNIANTMQIVLRERQYELGVVRAVGMGERTLQSLLVAEAGLSGLFSGAVGVTVSALLLFLGAKLLAKPMAPILGGAPSFDLPPKLILALLVLTPIASALAAWFPARQAVGSSIATSLRR
jgi:hypothetical protein